MFILVHMYICACFRFSLTAFARGVLPPEDTTGGGSIVVIPESVHQLTGVTVTIIDGQFPTAIFTFDYYSADTRGFFESDIQTYSQYIGWDYQLNTPGTWLNNWVLVQLNLYSNWFDFSLVVNEALFNWREFYRLTIENELLTDNLVNYEDYISQLEAEIARLENDLADGGYWQDGYNAGITDGQSVSSGIISIFTAPLTLLSGWFNFTIFGINFASLIKFFVSLALVAWLFKN